MGTLPHREPTGTLRREATYGSSTLSVPVKSSSGFFGSIRGLFGRRGGSEASAGGRRRWGKGKDDNMDRDMSEEPDVRSEPAMPMSRARVVSDVGSRRRRGMTEDSARKAEEWVGAQHADVEEKGWASDGGVTPTATLVKRKKSKKGTVRSLERTGTVRSVASAGSAGSDSTATAEVLVLPQRQKRRSSLGVTGNSASAEALVPSVPSTAKSTTTTRTERRASMPVHAAPRPPAETVSLMSIVEGVARANRDGWAAYTNDGKGGSVGANGSAGGSRGLVEAKAPRPDTSTPRGRTVSVGAIVEGLPRAPGSVFLTHGSPYSTPAVPASFSGPEMSLGGSGTSSAGSSVKRPAKSPLRSALRTASPSRVPVPPPVPVKAPAPLLPIPVPAPILNGKGKGKEKVEQSAEQVPGKGDDSDDAASISSYETGHETFNEDGDETEHEEDHGKPPPPPPHEYTNGTVLHDSPVEHNILIEDYGYGGSDLSASSASTQIGAPSTGPKRRKSVRVSLQPTFSTTPPAIYDDTEDEEGGESRHAPWSSRTPAADMWEDSSEEDVEYQKAKKLLNRISRKEKKNR
ncbi:hypothetical protein B0H19DRAFT_1201898 [Mycena capillaripes]|nr:hypothetical protein B0H19DRAFT_1201898 [Mycena capillaripes]